MARLLVVENEPVTLRLLTTLLKVEKHEVTAAPDGVEALKMLEENSFDLMLSDIRMSPMDGIELLGKSREEAPAMPVIMLTAYGTVSTAIEALKLGAFDYLTKPFKVDELLNTVRRALDYSRAFQENAEMRAQLNTHYQLENIIAESPSMKKICEMIKRVAPTDTTVLVTGESGTGKELVAQAVHTCSGRSEKMLLSVHCAALPEAMQEKELFGYVKGAVDGADAHKAGVFEAAEGGTVLLEDVDAMPLSLQERLLHVLQDRKVTRLGSSETVDINVRVVATANDQLQRLVEQGAFRPDLYQRLGIINLCIDPLRDRREDILPIAYSIIRKETEADNKRSSLDGEVCEILESYDWPGNVRQLENCIKHALTFSDGGEITPENLPAQIRNTPRKPSAKPAVGGNLETAASLKAFLKDREKEYLEYMLERTGGDKEAAAKRLNISLATLYRKLPSQKDDAVVH